MTAEARAPAKINLTLHVTGQRADGYHTLDSLVVFAAVHDTVSARPAPTLSLSVDGAGNLGGDDNLVLRAARSFGPGRGAALHLKKRLPVAAGIGGGSADAAATLRLLSGFWGCDLPPSEAIRALGADVPVCLRARPARMRGIGDVLDAVPELPRLDILLVNPGVPIPTPAVFAALARRDNPPMGPMPVWDGAVAFVAWLGEQRNDLLAPALSLAPVLSETMARIEATGCLHTGMSGSGATCFGLFPPDGASARAAAAQISAARPDWWSVATRLI